QALLPRRRGLHGAPQPFVRLRRVIEPRDESRISLRAYGEDGAIEQGFLGCVSRRLEHEIRARLTGERGRAVDQAPLFRLDTQVERFAACGLDDWHGGIPSTAIIAWCNA